MKRSNNSLLVATVATLVICLGGAGVAATLHLQAVQVRQDAIGQCRAAMLGTSRANPKSLYICPIDKSVGPIQVGFNLNSPFRTPSLGEPMRLDLAGSELNLRHFEEKSFVYAYGGQFCMDLEAPFDTIDTTMHEVANPPSVKNCEG